ncbi:hypothetical protein USDA257_c21130 [Sinorhizobium fredii USDA 257]|uniref:Uncharacterized protein n=2 Tax=Rhizobium fredii TaxID=380 RepID=I3X489_SINF2|nr:hypothetical protein USDA257_c21130 [Sinorhizobium fredii USDA 257]
MRPVLAGRTFALVLVSPLRRARETCDLMVGPETIADGNLMEWNYGEYEGLTPQRKRWRLTRRSFRART